MGIFVPNLTYIVTSAMPISGTLYTPVLITKYWSQLLTSTFHSSHLFDGLVASVKLFDCRASSTSNSETLYWSSRRRYTSHWDLYTCTHRYRDFSSSYPFFYSGSCVTRLNASSILASSCRSLVSSWNIRCSRFLDLMGRVRIQMV